MIGIKHIIFTHWNITTTFSLKKDTSFAQNIVKFLSDLKKSIQVYISSTALWSFTRECAHTRTHRQTPNMP